MPTSTTGRFVWHELHTTDRAKATKFYAELMSWEIKEIEMGPGEPYSVASLGGKDVAGITKSKAPVFIPSHWLPYVGVDEVDAATKRATELGARVLHKPDDIPGMGRFAALSDGVAAGAAFAIYTSARPAPDEPERPSIGTFCWDELLTPDPEAATKFYVGLFGYDHVERDTPVGKYTVLSRGERRTAGVAKLPPGIPRPNWLPYLAVDDVDAMTTKATGLGAKVMMPAMDVPNIGRFSVVLDPTGAAVALFKGA